MSRVRTNIPKELHEGFLRYLGNCIPSWQMPPEKFFKSFEQGVKRYLKTYQQRHISTIWEIRDIAELETIKRGMNMPDKYAYVKPDKSNKARGIVYYMDYLKECQEKLTQAHISHDNSSIVEEFLKEGSVLDSHGNRYERNREARMKCIEHYGYSCYICGMNFEESYGEVGKGFIEVHHVVPLSQIKKEYEIDPVKDLRPLCSNCHSMVHRTTPIGDVEEMRKSFQM